ncbi:MAG: CCA tRNA nucleotidyltransferase [Phycisphaerales bacterium]|nr:CCA tRNA nucleotidyltransferase [Phycisphaerales bacterium]
MSAPSDRSPMDRTPKLLLAEAAKVLALRLRDAGHETYFAGGCVRDLLLGIEPADFDIATSATPDDVARVYPKARGVGESFGVMLVRESGHTIEVATFREDLEYHDGRRPSEVRFSTAALDVSRRDFTINGLFMDPETRRVVDFLAGQGERDLRDKLIRAIGDPEARIDEDRLRMLRAVRFAARFGFTIEPRTARAIEIHATALRSVSPERVGEELRTMLRHPSRAQGAALLEQFGLDTATLGSHLRCVASRRLAMLQPTEPSIFTTALAAWLLDRGDAEGTVVDRVQVAQLRTRLVLSNAEILALDAALAVREQLLTQWDALGVAMRCRTIASLGFEEALQILRAEQPELADRLRRTADKLLPTRALPKPLVDGDLLISRGLLPGKAFKELLHRAMDAQLEGSIATAEEGLKLLFPS